VRLTLGAIFIVLGIAIVVRSVAVAGIRVEEMPALALGAALVALGFARIAQARAILRAPP